MNNQSEKYMKQTCDKRKVIDYLAGMTDKYLTKMIEKYVSVNKSNEFETN